MIFAYLEVGNQQAFHDSTSTMHKLMYLRLQSHQQIILFILFQITTYQVIVYKLSFSRSRSVGELYSKHFIQLYVSIHEHFVKFIASLFSCSTLFNMTPNKIISSQLIRTVANHGKNIKVKYATKTESWDRTFLASSVQEDFSKAIEKTDDIPSGATTAILASVTRSHVL